MHKMLTLRSSKIWATNSGPFDRNIGMPSIANANERYRKGSIPINKYNTDGRRSIPQAAIYAVSTRFISEDISIVSIAHANRVSQRNRYNPIKKTPMLH